jgi:hypothetical protein
MMRAGECRLLMRLGGLLAAGLCMLPIARADGNGYLRVTAGEGCVRVQFDPTGKGHYAARGAVLRPFRQMQPGRVEVDGDTVRFVGGRYCLPGVATGGYNGPFDHGEDLPPTGTLGQSFTVPAGGGWLCDVWALLTCSGVPDSAVTFTLRRDGPSGAVVASRLVRPVPNDTDVHLALPEPVPPGTYYLEIGQKRGGCYWWGCNTDVYPGGTAYVNGQPQPGKDWRFGYAMADVGIADWQVQAVGPELRCEATLREQAIAGTQPALALEFPWRRDGYDTNDPAITPFRYLFTDSGYWLPVEAFKRIEADWALEPACVTAQLHGTASYDLRVAHGRKGLQPRMDPDRLSMLLGPGGRIAVIPPDSRLPDYYPRFFTSDPGLDPALNRFLLTFLTNHESCPSGYEWDALKLSWVGGPIHDSLQRVILHFTHRIDPDGYIWSRGESRGWDGGDCSVFDSRHYDSNAPFILACWRWYCTTGDRGFLQASLETVRKATDYLLTTLHGSEGLLTIDSPRHNGVCGTAGPAPCASSYWDCIPAGYHDAYINAYFLPALKAASELERATGNKARAAELEQLLPQTKAEFNRAFWDDGRGRYIGWVDAAGGRHDPGMTYVNTIAATYGLADAEKTRRMYRWMTDEPTASGKRDTFSRWVFAPRSNTSHCAEQYNRLAYEDWCEDGGAILWTAFYEIMSRAQALGPDDAWARFRQIVARFEEPDHLVGGNPLCHGEINNHGGPPGSVGVWGEFPESGIAPCAFLYAFVGVQVDIAGLHVRPALPKGLAYAGVDGYVFHGHRLKITSYRDRVVVEWPGGKRVLAVPKGGEALVTEGMIAGK